MEGPTTITRAQASCIFYGESIKAENERECERRLDDLVELDICYLDNDPTEPFVVAKIKIQEFPHRYKLYSRTTSSSLHVP
ncbi:hypothetical protein BDC45DRAFT_519650 [Circinella umbellata]|nr:hypothetical protein BDC45DRAFT_519650 [Circinella umbellata]